MNEQAAPTPSSTTPFADVLHFGIGQKSALPDFQNFNFLSYPVTAKILVKRRFFIPSFPTIRFNPLEPVGITMLHNFPGTFFYEECDVTVLRIGNPAELDTWKKEASEVPCVATTWELFPVVVGGILADKKFKDGDARLRIIFMEPVPDEEKLFFASEQTLTVRDLSADLLDAREGIEGGMRTYSLSHNPRQLQYYQLPATR